MDLAKFLESMFQPSNEIFIVYLIFIYSSLAEMSFIDIFVYMVALIGTPISYNIMIRKVKRKNRGALIALAVTTLFFALLSSMFSSLRNLKFLYLSTYTFLILVFLAFTIRLKWKISLHVSVLTASITILTIFNQVFYLAYLLVPLIVWSRIKLKAHDLYQTIAGFILGILVPLIFFI